MANKHDAAKEKLIAYRRTRDDLLARQMKNSESYDRAILSLSSGALALSLSFIKDIVPIGHGHAYALLVVSWVLFGASILLILGSYPTSQWGVNLQLEFAEKYYLDNDESYRNRDNCWGHATLILGLLAGASFVAAFICTIIFVTINLFP